MKYVEYSVLVVGSVYIWYLNGKELLLLMLSIKFV